jgi:hypothetical protein
MGPDTYMLSKEGRTTLVSLANLKADVFREAHDYCAKGGKQFQVIHTADTPAAYMTVPRAEVQFTCLSGSATARVPSATQQK